MNTEKETMLKSMSEPAKNPAAPSPTPWKSEDGEHGSISVGSEGQHIADISYWDEPGKPEKGWLTQDQARANAAFIVKCVNSHAALLKCLKDVQSALLNAANLVDEEGCATEKLEALEIKIEQVIEQAEGK